MRGAEVHHEGNLRCADAVLACLVQPPEQRLVGVTPKQGAVGAVEHNHVHPGGAGDDEGAALQLAGLAGLGAGAFGEDEQPLAGPHLFDGVLHGGGVAHQAQQSSIHALGKVDLQAHRLKIFL